MKFSRSYSTFEQWENAIIARLIPQPKYFLRIVHYIEKHPSASLAEARGHKPKEKITEKQIQRELPEAIEKAEQLKKIFAPEESFRYTLGTNISDKHVPVSFTGFYFSDVEFDYSDEIVCYALFDEFVRDVLGHRYPGRSYDLNDVLGEWGGLLREEHNAVVNHVEDGSTVHEFKVRGIVRDSTRGFWK
jgi:hypothetical protein